MIKLLTTLNIFISFGVWLPAWIKIYRTKSAKDYSLLSFVIIEWLQVSNLGIAISEGAWSLSVYLAVNAGIVLFTAGLVLRYQRRLAGDSNP